MLQNVSNCHKSERSRNKNNLPYFIVVLVIMWGLPGLGFTLHLTWGSINSITINESPYNFKGVFLGLWSTSVLHVLSHGFQILFWYAFSFQVHTWIFASSVSTTKLPSAGERLSEIIYKQKATLRSPEGRSDGNRELSARTWNSLASLDTTSTL